jgi:hypothetical protein
MCSTSMDNTRAQRLAKDCIKKAKAVLGTGWSHVSADLQWGLVASNILSLCLLQDESIDPKRVLELTAAVEQAAREILA